MTFMPSIVVDADACPVKSECMTIAKEFGAELVFVASVKNTSHKYEHATWIYVDWDKEAADLYMMNTVKKGDVAVTADIGLAAALLGKGAIVISPKGTAYTTSNIDSLLFFRHTAAKNRRRGIHSKGPKKFSREDKRNFQDLLTNILSNCAGE
ncbi:MAG: YaiI/YqxD family protein [Bacillus sp. (in: firmicutes)]